MNNTIREVSVDLEDWRDEQDAWNNRSTFFVELHNREDRKAQVTNFLSFVKEEIYYHSQGLVSLMWAVAYVIMRLV